MQPFQTAFIASVVPGAQASQKQYGIPASVTIAQAILESGWGEKTPPHSNNYFGIQNFHPTSPASYSAAMSSEFKNGVQTPEREKFMVYATVQDGFIAHARLLALNHRYISAMLAKGDPQAFAKQLQVDGYSSTPDYDSRLMEIVRCYNLTQYDHAPVNVV